MAVAQGSPLPPALDAERREVSNRAGRLSYYVAGQGPPLLLIHSVNAAGSAFEVKPIFDVSCERHRVFAMDLPGYGFSERSPRDYSVRLFTDAVHDMLDAIGESDAAPVDALAVSLASEFLARAAVERPERFRTLTFVTPTGFSKRSGKLRGAAGMTREVHGLQRAFNVRLWSRALYDALVSRRSIRYFLQRTFGSKRVPDALVDYAYLSTHQPSARHAPYAFLSGRLFSRDIRAVYEELQLPIWMPHATRGDFKDFSAAGWALARANWRVQPMPTGALPHFEMPADFGNAFEAFLMSGGAYPREEESNPSAAAGLASRRRSSGSG